MSTASLQKKIIKAAPPPAASGKWKLVLQIVALQIVAILLVECFFFLNGIGEEEIFRFDREIGFKHMPNKRITWRTEGFATSYFDADGMREPDLTVNKFEGTKRVALLGDSMVEGLQVPIEHTFGAYIQDALQREGQQVQVLNFGTSGYSTVQQYMQLKNRVMKYKPDVVVLCYSSRDMFENWSSDKNVITNVRPLGIHLPNGYLFFDDSMVRRWMKSPRGKFLTSIDWIRQNSRIWGVWAALELNMSINNPLYKIVLTAFTSPKRAFGELQHFFATLPKSNGPSWEIKFFEGDQHAAQQVRRPKKTDPKANSIAPNAVLATNSAIAKPTQAEGQQVYKKVVVKTLTSLIDEMRKYCQSNGAKLVVVTLPSRAQVAPAYGLETSFCGIDYAEEVALVKQICRSLKVPMADCEGPAEALPEKARKGLFYTVHLSPEGQTFMANQLLPFIRQSLAKRPGDGR